MQKLSAILKSQTEYYKEVYDIRTKIVKTLNNKYDKKSDKLEYLYQDVSNYLLLVLSNFLFLKSFQNTKMNLS